MTQPGNGAPADSVHQWLGWLDTERRYSTHTLTGYRQDMAHLQRLYPEQPLGLLSNGHFASSRGQASRGRPKAQESGQSTGGLA